MADINALLDFLRQGLNQGGAVTKFNDGTMGAPETDNINQYGPIPKQVVAPVTAAYDPASAPIDLNDFAGAGSVDQSAIQSQDNMAPAQAPVVAPTQNKTTGMNKAQAKKADSLVDPKNVTSGTISNSVPEMIALDEAGTSISAPKAPSVSNGNVPTNTQPVINDIATQLLALPTNERRQNAIGTAAPEVVAQLEEQTKPQWRMFSSDPAENVQMKQTLSALLQRILSGQAVARGQQRLGNRY